MPGEECFLKIESWMLGSLTQRWNGQNIWKILVPNLLENAACTPKEQ